MTELDCKLGAGIAAGSLMLLAAACGQGETASERPRLAWDAPASGPAVATYRVYVSSDGLQYREAATTAATEVPLSHLGLTPGGTYYACVTSVGESGIESVPSGAVSFQY